MKMRPIRFSLRTQILLVMIAMTLVSLGSLSYLQEISEDRLLGLVQKQIYGLTRAIEVSVGQIKPEGNTDEARLKDYISHLKMEGINEISILSNDQEVILSSNPNRVGSRVSVKKKGFIITAKIGNSRGGEKKVYNAIVPIVLKGKLEGYIHISMYLDDFKSLNQEMLKERMAFTLPVFGLGILFCFIISFRFTRPISALIDAIHSISEGKKPSLKKIEQSDLVGLADSLDDMFVKLQEKEAMSEKLKRVEHQAMLAQLASGIAHEIRNPLNFISLSIDHISGLLASDSLQNQGEVVELTKKMKLEVRRVNQMATNFLDLGRELILSPLPLRADLPIEDALGTMKHLLSERRITVVRNYCEPVPVITVDVDRIKSCFMNLIHNAADAMPEGGTLSIAIRNQKGLVEITFEDTGHGIGKEEMAKIFEPYFTTKETGMGLGLAIAKRVVEAHNGKIDFSSAPGQGTCARVSLFNMPISSAAGS